MRHYVASATPTSGDAILQDAFRHGEPGAKEVLRLALSMRRNPRTQRPLSMFREQSLLADRRQEKWYRDTKPRLLALFRCLRKLATPNQPHVDEHLEGARSLQRKLAGAGIMTENRETLKARATKQADLVLRETQGKQLVLWMDNHYLERYGTDPGDDLLSTNVTAMAVLVVDRHTDSRVATRTIHWPAFPGHLEFEDLIAAVTTVANDLVREATAFTTAVARTAVAGLGRGDIRVPLDAARPERRTLQWTPYDLSQLQVGRSQDLLLLLQDVLALQQRTQGPLPLLVDENVHYRIARLLYSKAYRRWAVGDLLKRVPLVYGVWHAYKHTLTVVYRAFFPVLAHLEATGEPQTGNRLRRHRKVVDLEKLFAVLYLLRERTLPRIAERLQRLSHTGVRVHPDGSSSSRDVRPSGVQRSAEEDRDRREAVRMLTALHDLLDFWAPAMLRIGFLVRECTWNGRPQGTVQGETARRILLDCLLLQVHLQDDWDAVQEYTRTMSIALLMWQPWLSGRPGCAFVEESGEALLSRYAATCRKHRTLSGYASAWRLFITLRLQHPVAPATRGSVRKELVLLLGDRLEALLERPAGRPFPSMTNATEGRWVERQPETAELPSRPPTTVDAGKWQRVLKSALAVVHSGPDPTPEAVQWCMDNVDDVDHERHRDRRAAHAMVERWTEERRTRVRIAAVSLRPPRQRAARGERPAEPGGLPSGSQESLAAEVPETQAGVVPRSPSTESLYEPPDQEEELSQGYVSPGETDGLGSVGDLEEPEEAASGDDGLPEEDDAEEW
jgi:hypothetical protein